MPDGAVITPDKAIDSVGDVPLDSHKEAAVEAPQGEKPPLIPVAGTVSSEQAVTVDGYQADEDADRVRDQLGAEIISTPEAESSEQKAIREYTGILDKVATAIKMRSNPKDSDTLSQDVYYADQLILDEPLLPAQLDQMGLSALARELRIAEGFKKIPEVNEPTATRTLQRIKENIGFLRFAKPEDLPFTGFRIFNNPGSGLQALDLDVHYSKDRTLFNSGSGFLSLKAGRGVKSGDRQALDPDNFSGEGHSKGAEQRLVNLARDVESLTNWAITNNKASTRSSDSTLQPKAPNPMDHGSN